MSKELKKKLETKEIELDQVTDDYNWSEIAKKEALDEVEKLKQEAAVLNRDLKRVCYFIMLFLMF
jgi:hypothetical protein